MGTMATADTDLFSFPGFADSRPPWATNDRQSTKAKAILLQRLYSDSDDLKRRLWANNIIIFRALLHFSEFQFDREFYRLVSDACNLASANAASIKDLAAYWSRRRQMYLREHGRDDRNTSLFTRLVDAWISQYERWRSRTLAFIPDAAEALEDAIDDWSVKIRDVDGLLDSQAPVFPDPWRGNHLSRPVSPSKRSSSPAHTYDNEVSHQSKRRRVDSVDQVGATNLPLSRIPPHSSEHTRNPNQSSTPGTPRCADHVNKTVIDTRRSSGQENATTGVWPNSTPSGGLPRDAQKHASVKSTSETQEAGPEGTGPGLLRPDNGHKELFDTSRGRPSNPEGKSQGFPEHLLEPIQTTSRQLSESVQSLDRRFASLKHDVDSVDARHTSALTKLEETQAETGSSITSLKDCYNKLDNVMGDMRRSLMTLPPPRAANDALHPVSDFRQLYMEQPGLANLVLLTETYINQLDSRQCDAEKQLTSLQDAMNLQAQQQASTKDSVVRLEEHVERLTRQVSENERIVRDQAAQIQSQNETIKQLQTQQSATLASMQEQLNSVTQAVANHSADMGLESRLISTLDMARIYHRRENFKTHAHMEASARVVVQLEAAVNSLMHSKGK